MKTGSADGTPTPTLEIGYETLLTDKALESVFTTWKVDLRDDAGGLKSAWAVLSSPRHLQSFTRNLSIMKPESVWWLHARRPV